MPPQRADAPDWITIPEGIAHIGVDPSHGFSFDNESPRHKTFLASARVADHLVTNAAALAFIEADGYQRPDLWLADGWAEVRRQGWSAPLYWERLDDQWHLYTLAGLRPVRPDEPLCHVSHYEADAVARFLGARLPTEAEWEVACALRCATPVSGTLDDGALHPTPRVGAQDQLLGHVWEWTRSAYLPYPGFQPAPGAVGEYNGKFMSGQMVLRGGCALTPRDHLRPSYRNFFSPASRWQLSGLRLAQDA
jgi:ergothioneine biosynthesis protein EgtB